MNKSITEIKNTLEGTNSRITEAEDRISDLEDRMVEIDEAEKKKEKKIKEMGTTSGTMLMPQHSNHRSHRRKQK